MSDVQMALIVEGHGDAKAVPELVRRICWRTESLKVPSIDERDVIRTGKHKLLRENELERRVEYAARKIDGEGCILVVIDADEQCPAQLGPELLRRAQSAREDMDIAVVLPNAEFENWFIAGCSALLDRDPPDEIEEIGDAKGWLERASDDSIDYRPALDQKDYVHEFDLDQALELARGSRCRSLRKLLTELENLLSVD